jgi:hypothetical protein
VTSLAALVLSALLTPSPAGAPPDPSVAAVPASPPPALEVLHAWDRQRARAWARADVAALRRAYVAESRSGRADVAMLRAYAARGLSVTGLSTQVLAVDVRTRMPDRLELRVTDRLVGGVVRGAGGTLALPADRPTTQVVVMRRVEGRWRVVEVRA